VRVDAGSFDRWTGPDRLPWLVLGIATLLVFFIGVGERQMHGTAAFYASMSRQIADTGVWLPLHRGPEPYFLKPPLVFWLTALSIELLGPTNLAASLWPRLFGIGCVALTALIARRAYGAAAGVLAGLACITNATLLETANTLRLDTALLFFMLLSLWAYLSPRGRWRPPVFYGAIALAVLAKGPQGFLPLALAGLHAWSAGRWTRPARADARPWLAWAPLLALPLLYYGDHVLRFGSDFFARLANDASMKEVFGPLDHAQQALEGNFIDPLLRWLPFSPFMVWGVWRTFGRLRRETHREARALDLTLVAWIGVLLLLLSLRESYRMRYVMLVLPPLAMLGGREIARLLGDRIPARATRIAAAVLVLALLLLASLRPSPDPTDGMAGVAIMVRLFDEQLVDPDAPVPVLLPEGEEVARHGMQNSLRDWIHFYLGRPARAVHPSDARAAPPGQLYFVYWDHIEQMRGSLPIRVLIHSRRAYLAERIPK